MLMIKLPEKEKEEIDSLIKNKEDVFSRLYKILPISEITGNWIIYNSQFGVVYVLINLEKLTDKDLGLEINRL